jgi:uncharacterized membrane protein
MNRHRLSNFIMLVAITLVAMGLAFTNPSVIRSVFGLLLVCVLPGYAMMSAWFPRRLVKYPANVLFVITLSLSITALGSLVLHKTLWGLQTTSWTLGLGAFTLVNLIIGWVRGETNFGYTRVKSLPVPAYQIALMVCAVLISALALQLGRQGAVQQQDASFTQLWMLPGEDQTVHVGVKNQEYGAMNYKLVIKDGEQIFEETFKLGVNESWEMDFVMPETPAREVNAYLSRLDMPHSVYRSTSLWLPYTE